MDAFARLPDDSYLAVGVFFFDVVLVHDSACFDVKEILLRNSHWIGVTAVSRVLSISNYSRFSDLEGVSGISSASGASRVSRAELFDIVT